MLEEMPHLSSPMSCSAMFMQRDAEARQAIKHHERVPRYGIILFAIKQVCFKVICIDFTCWSWLRSWHPVTAVDLMQSAVCNLQCMFHLVTHCYLANCGIGL